MNDTSKRHLLERTPEQKAEERRIRELHRENPIRVVPTDTIDGEDVVQLLKFVNLIRKEREAQGLSLEQLAERAGMDVAALSRLESAQNFNPTAATMFRLARALGKSLSVGFASPSQTDPTKK